MVIVSSLGDPAYSYLFSKSIFNSLKYTTDKSNLTIINGHRFPNVWIRYDSVFAETLSMVRQVLL